MSELCIKHVHETVLGPSKDPDYLLFKHVHETVLGPSKGPGPLFKRFKEVFLILMTVMYGTDQMMKSRIGDVRRLSGYWNGQIPTWNRELEREKTTENFLS